jgi:glycosyltransferase involved in cell wall biosynthesis
MAERMLRVAHVFGQMNRGGAELRTVEIAESFGGREVRSDFVVLTGLDGSVDARIRAAGGEVLKCPLDARFPFAFYRLVRRGRYDVVHSHVHFFSGVVLAIARMAGVAGRVAHFRTSVVNDKADTVARTVQLATCRRLIQFCATDILAVGEGTMRDAWRSDWPSDPRCRVVYNGLPPARVRRAPVERPSTPTIINVASIQPRKNQVHLVRVLRQCIQRLPAATLVLVGREVGDYGREVRRIAAELGIADRVRFAGEVDDPISLVARSSLLVLPSIWEGLPGAALEACAIGVPVLASDLPGTRELAAHFPNMTVMPLTDSPQAWADRAVELIQIPNGADPDAVAQRFANSPFTLARARESHYQVWSRGRASA